MVDVQQQPQSDGLSSRVGQGPPLSMFDALVLSFLLSTDGRVLSWGGHAEELTGWPDDEVAGRPLTDLLEDERADDIVHQAVDTVQAGKDWRGILTLRRRDGTPQVLESMAQPTVLGDGSRALACTCVESEFVIQAEQALSALNTVFDQAPMGIAIYDADLRFVRVNAALARIDGISPAAHHGRTVRELLPDIDYLAIERAQRHTLETGEPVLDQPVWGSTPGTAGRIRLWSVSHSRLISAEGAVIGLCGLINDATDRHQHLAESESARARLTLLDELGSQIGSSLDLQETADALINVVVPRLADVAALHLLEDVLTGDEMPRISGDTLQARRLAAVSVWDELIQHPLEPGPTHHYYAPHTAYAVALRRRSTVTVPVDAAGTMAYGYDADFARRAETMRMHTSMFVPVIARGVPLGALVLCQCGDRPPFTDEERQLAEDLAARAAISIDNARLYSRERRTALLLQRSLLPKGLPVPTTVDVAHRYLPGSGTAEAGGDWFDAIPLSGRRVALVVGDVMGHGVRAAVVMGQLRTAVRTLSALDLSPAEVLSQLDDLARTMSEDHLATCIYAVFDPIERTCTLARAGHLPPILVGADRTARPLDLPAGAPLGVGGVEFRQVTVDVGPDTLVVLYTDGLVEDRYGDLDAEIGILANAITSAVSEWPSVDERHGHADDERWHQRPMHVRNRALEELCDRMLATQPAEQSDDVTALVARLHAIAPEDVATWDVPAEPSGVTLARGLARAKLHDWGLDAAIDSCELLISELVTNAVTHGDGPIRLRLVRGDTLLCEVSDAAGAPPRPRAADAADEDGRGLQLVQTLAARWGTRQTDTGKVVWFEYPCGEVQHPYLPDDDRALGEPGYSSSSSRR